MKTIGLLGGMSWESTTLYYRLINEATRERRGGFHSAPIAMVSVDFAEIEALQRSGDWVEAGARLASDARAIERAGADVLLICTNTMHKVADAISAAINIPLLHLADATAQRIRADGLDRVALLGTRFTMAETFYRGRLEAQGLVVDVPNGYDMDLVHTVIFDELCQGVINSESRTSYSRIIDALAADGAQGVIAGCTEIGMLVSPEDCPVPLYDTTVIHAQAAVDWALSD
ncbi:MAG: aspartate/glutamate racemase family protein [Pseudomonadota bacterium]